ncbi:glycine betaine ABC transporter substrate-binding protein [Paraconexibacter sp.]|uniref:ABC transporter substrate-binding protein n=1 Tax=Paraconexibacter sp. TaxID=2949640 RepID=UPI0035689551
MTTTATRRLLAALLAVFAVLAISACGDDSDNGSAAQSTSPTETAAGSSTAIVANPANASVPEITIASKNFTEQFILGEIYAQALEAAGYKVKKQLNLGSEQIAFKAIKQGDVDAYPEYTGTALTSFFDVKTDDIPKDEQQAYERTKQGFAESELTALPPTPFTDSNAVGMTKKRADELGIKTISDLADKSADLTMSGSPECRQRTDCLLGIEKTYGAKFKKYVPVDLALRHEVLTKGQADASIVFSTDGQIVQQDLVVLEDDKELFPPYNVTLVVRDEVLEAAGPDLAKVVEQVQAGLSTEVMQELNSRVDLDKQKPDVVAKAYLTESGFLE